MSLGQSKLFSRGVFESNESIYHPVYLRFPFNSFTSFIYWLPVLYIPLEYPINIYQNTNYLGICILSCLAPVSFIWWSTSNRRIKYIDNGLVLSTMSWLISDITHTPKLNYLIPFYFCLRNDRFIKHLEVGSSLLLVWFNPNIISNILFSLGLVGKISDSYLGNPYGTGLFHIFSGLAIFTYFYE